MNLRIGAQRQKTVLMQFDRFNLQCSFKTTNLFSLERAIAVVMQRQREISEKALLVMLGL